MFSKVLIANRGEIACRIIRTARRLGISTVAVYSDVDKNALHVSMADEAVSIGAAPARDSYLSVERIISAAKKTKADAIHPGYGFLSEQPSFCLACEKSDITFIGPPVGAIEAMGSKSAAKSIMQKAGVPLVPGYHGSDQDPELMKKHADDMGYPVLLKAAAGGGGKGMREVWKEGDFFEALAAAKREAASSFNDDTMLVEKYLTAPRHIEIQVFCDQHGNSVHLFERDCSIQRRHQKIIEEAPATGITAQTRDAMGEAAIRAAQSINYVGAGTVEFLLNEDGTFYFMEMNTRLQVEHPITEMITGQDLVEWQFRVADGESLPMKQSELSVSGHAVEARIYAEEPDRDFLPATGNLTFLQQPSDSDHVRVETGVRQGDDISVYYDPMIAKLVVWGVDRERALSRLSRAMNDYRIAGVATNIDFLRRLISTKQFRNAEIDTGFIEKNRSQIAVQSNHNAEQNLLLIALYIQLDRHRVSITNQRSTDFLSPWDATDSWRSNVEHCEILTVQAGEKVYKVIVRKLHGESNDLYAIRIDEGSEILCSGKLNDSKLHANIEGVSFDVVIACIDANYTVFSANGASQLTLVQPDYGSDAESQTHTDSLAAPMNGTIVALQANLAVPVKKGEALLVMEAMKMEHTVYAPTSGQVSEFFYRVGELVDGGATLLAFEPCSDSE